MPNWNSALRGNKSTKGERRRQRSRRASCAWASQLFFNLPILPLKRDLKSGAGGETCTPVGHCPAVYKTAAVATEPRRPLKWGIRNAECGIDGRLISTFVPLPSMTGWEQWPDLSLLSVCEVHSSPKPANTSC